ncbi:integrase catalytic domain-containing protein [Trichonephila clavipes]|nr:integrase catalytic domain-containing protein [Trichonephila clavipes]
MSDLCENLCVQKKIAKLIQDGKCFICCNTGCYVKRCKKEVCSYCKGRHARAICFKLEKSKQNSHLDSEEKNVDVKTTSANSVFHNRGGVLLQCVKAEIIGRSSSDKIFCLFDNGSEKSFIKKNVSRRKVEVRLRNVLSGEETVIEALEIEEISKATLSLPNPDAWAEMESKGRERVNNLLTYVSQEDLSNYVKIKELILREFEPTPQECLSNFKKARKLPSENYVQFASRLSATFDYYCQLRKVNEFRSLCDLIISDKIFETLDRDTMNHIATKQGETYFKPQQLGRECDVYLSARGKVSNDLMSRNPGSGVKTDGRNRLQTVSTWRQERNSSNVFVAETKPNCVLCKGNNFHPLSKCYQFKKLSVEDRVEVVKRNNLCFRCFLPHRLKECRSEKNCFCLRPHNSLIHFSRDKTRNPTPTSNLNLDAPTFVPGQIEGSVEANSQSQFVATGFEKGRLKNVFLSTVRALVKNKYSQWVEVRCLLDVGSQSCLCTRACAEKLQLKMEKINTVVSCVNDASMVVKNCVKTSVANKAKTFESELMLLVVNKITDLIPNKVIDVDVNVSEFVPLADDKFNIPDRIDMLLGAEIFYELLKPGKFYCDNSHLVLQNTVFGYVVSGSVDQVTENRVHCGLIVDDDLNKTLKKFWEIEGVHIEPKVDTEVSLCEDHFVRTHRRNCEGRYVVSMALNKDPSCLGNSKDIAIRRLNSLWKRLSRDSSYLSLYAEFLKEYEELGHLERVVESSEPPTHYYIPHHGVLRPEKLTTKLRIVFNGSSPPQQA